MQQLERGPPVAGEQPVVSSGVEALNELLPQGGFPAGTLVEWIAAEEGAPATTLAIMTAKEACGEQGVLVVLDRKREFYPPAAAGAGIDLARTIIVQPDSDADQLWAVDQSLRCGGVAAVLCPVQRLDGRNFRRWQLAAEEGGGLGLLIRPAAARRERSWAEVRLWVEPQPASESENHTMENHTEARRLRIELLRCRHGKSGGALLLEIDDETGDVRVAPPLAPRAPLRRATGA